MIARTIAMFVLLYLIGFVLFAVTLGEPAADDEPKTDAAVVLTGGAGRIEHAIDVIKQGKARRLLVSGTDPAVTKADLAGLVPGSAAVFRCCVDLGSEAVDTRSNAEETRRWVERRKYRSIRLITSDYHMRRAHFDLRRELGSDVRIISDAVHSEPGLITLFSEYSDYVLRRISVWLDL